MQRRGFLSGILAAGIAPAVLSQGSVMRIWVPQPELDTLEGGIWRRTWHTSDCGGVTFQDTFESFGEVQEIIPGDSCLTVGKLEAMRGILQLNQATGPYRIVVAPKNLGAALKLSKSLGMQVRLR